MSPSRAAVKSAAPFLIAPVRAWHRALTTWRSRPSYVARHAPFLSADSFDQVFFDNRGNHPTQHLRATRRLVDLRGAHVLALGCRDGAESGLWLQHGARAVTGLDYVPRTLAWRQLSAQDARARFVTGDARQLPFPDNTFDLVSSESLLEHVRHPEPAIDEMHRVVRPGGLVYAIFGPLFNTAGGAHFEGDFEHLLLERDAFLKWIDSRNRPIEREECLTYFARDMFSYWTADDYLRAFGRYEIVRSAVFVSPAARRFRETHPAEWQALRATHPERDLMISGLALWSRKRH